MILHSGKITGAGATVLLSTLVPQPAGYVNGNSLQAKSIQLQVSGGTVLVGGPEVTSSVGYPIPTAGLQFLPPIADLVEFWDLSQIYAYVPNGATLYALYGG